MAREIPVDPAHLDRRPAGSEQHDESRDWVADLVESLPELDRAVVECLVWGGMTKVECAELLGISRSYVHKIWRRARSVLRNQLSDDNGVGPLPADGQA